MTPLHDISLRERKYAQTKLGILYAFLEMLKKETLENISIKELCREANICEGTFFNYFPKKDDILAYYISIWSIEVQWIAIKKEKENSSLSAIEEIFYYTADLMQTNVPIMYELIALLARQREVMAIGDITLPEKLLAFKNFPGAEKLNGQNFLPLVKPFLKSAVAKGELPIATDIDSTLLTLRAILFGTPIALTQTQVKKVKEAYQKHLNILWRSLKKTPRDNKD